MVQMMAGDGRCYNDIRYISGYPRSRVPVGFGRDRARESGGGLKRGE